MWPWPVQGRSKIWNAGQGIHTWKLSDLPTFNFMAHAIVDVARLTATDMSLKIDYVVVKPFTFTTLPRVETPYLGMTATVQQYDSTTGTYLNQALDCTYTADQDVCFRSWVTHLQYPATFCQFAGLPIYLNDRNKLTATGGDKSGIYEEDNTYFTVSTNNFCNPAQSSSSNLLALKPNNPYTIPVSLARIADPPIADQSKPIVYDNTALLLRADLSESSAVLSNLEVESVRAGIQGQPLAELSNASYAGLPWPTPEGGIVVTQNGYLWTYNTNTPSQFQAILLRIHIPSILPKKPQGLVSLTIEFTVSSTFGWPARGRRRRQDGYNDKMVLHFTQMIQGEPPLEEHIVQSDAARVQATNSIAPLILKSALIGFAICFSLV